MGGLERDLGVHTVIGVDTAPFIYLWEKHSRYYSMAETLFRYLGSPQVRGVTSVITLIEACIHPQRHNRPDLVQAYEQALLHSEQIHMLPVDIGLARRSVLLRAKYGIHVPDGLQIAAALESGATLFVTNDRRLARVKEISVLLFEDYVS